METYSVLRQFADSWGLLIMFAVFVTVIVWAFRPGSSRIYKETAEIPFRHEDRPARAAHTAKAAPGDTMK